MGPPRTATLDHVARRFPQARVTPLAGDVSSRRFFRLTDPGGGSRVLMEYPEPFERSTDDIRLGAIFRSAGLPVAGILDSCPEVGCLVLEDLGDRTLEQALGEAGRGTPAARELLERAVRLAVDVAVKGTPALLASDRADGPALDAARFCFEMDYFLEHFAAGLRGIAPDERLRASLHALAERTAASGESVFCHRDFHSRNLMVRGDGSLAMVDIQDARWGPDTYDLASLLCDAYVESDPAWFGPLAESYRSALPQPPERGPFLERLRRVSAQRMLKALGTFGYQVARMGRERFRPAIPRTQARLRALLAAAEATRPLLEGLSRAGLL